MEIMGRSYELLLTVGATEEISALCPDGDIRQIKEIFNGPAGALTDFMVRFIAALSKGAEERKAFMTPGYEPHPATPEILRLMTPDELKKAQADAMEAFKVGKSTTVEAAEGKKNEADGAGHGSGSI